jgi:hypothetical protein
MPIKRALLDSIDVSGVAMAAEAVQVMAAGESVTTKLYDRTNDEIIFDEVERIAILIRSSHETGQQNEDLLVMAV